MGNGGGYDPDPSSFNRVDLKNGGFTLSGQPLSVKYGRRGVQIGCHFMTYEALDKLYKDSQ